MESVKIGLLLVVALTAALQGRRLEPSAWGGEHLRMTVTDSGAQLEFDCAAGAIDQPIVLDASGRFTAKGSYSAEHGGPRRREPASGAGARYTGRVNREAMQLTITLDQSNERVGTFTLKRDADVLLTKCR